MEVTCSEATGQEAVFRMEIPDTDDNAEILKVCDVKSYIMTGELFAKPCLPTKNGGATLKQTDGNTLCAACCTHCGK